MLNTSLRNHLRNHKNISRVQITCKIYIKKTKLPCEYNVMNMFFFGEN